MSTWENSMSGPRVDGFLQRSWRQAARHGTLGMAALCVGLALLGRLDVMAAPLFHPHGYCYLWRLDLVSGHVAADLLIGLSYVAISGTLWYLVSRARGAIPFSWVFIAFGTFIVACGGTHFMEVLTLWEPWFWTSMGVKLVTAAASVATAVALPSLVPKVFELLEQARLSEQRQMALQEKNVELEQANLAKGQMEEELWRTRKLESLGVLAGGIAHDFNNFLTIIQGSIQLAEMQLDPDAPVRRTLERTAGACQRAVFLSSQLLTFAKGGVPIRRVVSVSSLVVDAVHLARSGAAVSIVVDIAEGLWLAEVDAGQIGQVLHNLLLNAKQAMGDGGTIEVRAENVVLGEDKTLASGAHVRISVRDYGCGISADVLPRIFDPYFTTKRSGHGLGLATTHSIVTKHGGRLSVTSTDGEGAVFIVDLPASQSSPATESSLGVRLRSGTGRLLVMDDEDTLRTLLVAVLVTLGYEVLGARHGAEAIDLYEAANASGRGFDAVLLDVTVSGGMGGVEAARRLKELDPAAKLVASTGYSDAPVMSAFLEYGFDDVLPKPWTVVQLSEVFQRVLQAPAWR
jgi:signal transduction histidine kinase/CheY-like chemotaxis protein